MASLLDPAWPGLLLGPGAFLTLMAAVVVWRTRRGPLSGWLLTAGCLLGVAGLVSMGVRLGWRPSNRPTLALAATGMATGLWSVALYGKSRRVQGLAGLVAGVAMGTFLVAPNAVVPGVQGGGLWFGLDEVFFVLACGVLLLGSICADVPTSRPNDAATRWVLALGLLLQTMALGSRAVGVQLAWGAYWWWGPVGSWRLAAWLSTAIAALGLWQMGWAGRRAQIAVHVVTAAVLLVLLGSVPLVRWLGLGELYLRG